MARLRRFVIVGQPQHVIQRGNNRDITFVCDDDFLFYLDKLQLACEKFKCELHAYVLMTNHVHLLVTPNVENGISKVMQSVGRSYVQYFNYTYKRTGTLWEGRYRATLIDSESYLLICSRYIELNPVRANMVEHPSDYPWSSYHKNANGKIDSLLTAHLLYKQLGKTSSERENAYRYLFRTSLSKDVLNDIRETSNKAWILGNERFKEQIKILTSRQLIPKTRGGDRRSKEFGKSKINRV